MHERPSENEQRKRDVYEQLKSTETFYPILEEQPGEIISKLHDSLKRVKYDRAITILEDKSEVERVVLGIRSVVLFMTGMLNLRKQITANETTDLAYELVHNRVPIHQAARRIYTAFFRKYLEDPRYQERFLTYSDEDTKTDFRNDVRINRMVTCHVEEFNPHGNVINLTITVHPSYGFGIPQLLEWYREGMKWLSSAAKEVEAAGFTPSVQASSPLFTRMPKFAENDGWLVRGEHGFLPLNTLHERYGEKNTDRLFEPLEQERIDDYEKELKTWFTHEYQQFKRISDIQHLLKLGFTNRFKSIEFDQLDPHKVAEWFDSLRIIDQLQDKWNKESHIDATIDMVIIPTSDSSGHIVTKIHWPKKYLVREDPAKNNSSEEIHDEATFDKTVLAIIDLQTQFNRLQEGSFYPAYATIPVPCGISTRRYLYSSIKFPTCTEFYQQIIREEQQGIIQIHEEFLSGDNPPHDGCEYRIYIWKHPEPLDVELVGETFEGHDWSQALTELTDLLFYSFDLSQGSQQAQEQVFKWYLIKHPELFEKYRRLNRLERLGLHTRLADRFLSRVLGTLIKDPDTISNDDELLHRAMDPKVVKDETAYQILNMLSGVDDITSTEPDMGRDEIILDSYSREVIDAEYSILANPDFSGTGPRSRRTKSSKGPVSSRHRKDSHASKICSYIILQERGVLPPNFPKTALSLLEALHDGFPRLVKIWVQEIQELQRQVDIQDIPPEGNDEYKPMPARQLRFIIQYYNDHHPDNKVTAEMLENMGFDEESIDWLFEPRKDI